MPGYDALQDAGHVLQTATRLAVLSGAGLSKASGIPTYRDADGLWMDKTSVKFSHVDDLKRDPAGFHAFWAARLKNVEGARPNPGHFALAELQSLKPETTLITQNVDGLLDDAGARSVLELHGSLRRWRCDRCGNKNGPWHQQNCPQCGSQARPDVVMFGEALDIDLLSAARDAAEACDVFVVVGSTAAVFPANALPLVAAERGASIITVNMEPIELNEVATVVVRGAAEALLPQMVACLRLV